MALFFHQSVTRLRAPLVSDGYGETRNWAAATETALEQVEVQPITQAELISAGRDASIRRWRFFTRRGVDVDLVYTDRIRWTDLAGDVLDLEVEGDVARWPMPGGRGVHHVEAVLKKVDG